MKRLSAYCLLPLLLLITDCTTNERGSNPEDWSEKEVNEWFDRREWLGETDMRPDTTINKRQFAKRYHENKDRWDTAFAFIRKGDFSSLSAGDHELDGKDVFVKVTEYNSKDPEEVFYESHKNYADIQYVVSGMEYIGQSDLKGAAVKTPYNEEKDIQFYHVSDGRNLLAKPGTFFIFFPGEGHCPGMKVGDNTPVKKMVIKVHN
jgi:biofilm protein TabA